MSYYANIQTSNNMDILPRERRQLHLWSRNNAQMPYIGPITSTHASHFNYTQNLLPWRPITEYKPLTTITSICDCVSDNSNINSIKFPNLATRCKCNAASASKIVGHAQYTPDEWYQKQMKYYNEADSCRNFSERVRNDVIRIIRDADGKVESGQYSTGRKLGERINDISFWKNEVVLELERILQETERLQDCRAILHKTIQDIESPLHITEECLYYRKARKDSELVHDDVEKCLLKEIKILNDNRKSLEICLDKCKDQLRDCRVSQCRLELDLKNKENALEIDAVCHQLNNYSHGLEYYAGIEKSNSRFSEPDSWTDAVNQIIEKSQTERNKSYQLRTNVESLIRKVGQEIWDAWKSTNDALALRTSELQEAKNRLQLHLQKVQQEMFDVEKNLELIRKAITDKSYSLKLAYTRIKTRMHRPNIELCRDYAHISLQNEIEDINRQMGRMSCALKELENQHQKLLKARTMLEHDLALKVDAIHIDREKVSGLRRTYPMDVLFRF